MADTRRRQRPAPTSKADLLEVAAQLDVVRHALLEYSEAMESRDPNQGRITEARDYLEAAAGRLRCAI